MNVYSMRIDLMPAPCLPAIAILFALGGCADERQAPATPSFYRTLASESAHVDPIAARDMISVYRRNNGLPTLVVDAALQKAAEEQAQAMAHAGSYGRDQEDGFKKRLAGVGAGTGSVENISAGYHTLAEAFSGWRESKSHNANMLNPGVARMGIATAYAPGSKYKVYWALVLAR